MVENLTFKNNSSMSKEISITNILLFLLVFPIQNAIFKLSYYMCCY